MAAQDAGDRGRFAAACWIERLLLAWRWSTPVRTIGTVKLMVEPRTVTISIPPDLATQVDDLAAREGRTRSELFREAARQYLRRQQRWELIFAEGERVAVRAGIRSEEEVAETITERRRDTRRRG